MVRFGAKRRNLFLLFIFHYNYDQNYTLSIKTSFKRHSDVEVVGKNTFTKPEHK